MTLIVAVEAWISGIYLTYFIILRHTMQVV